MTNDPCRDAFEKWYKSDPVSELPTDNHGFYDNKYTQARFEAWQAAWNARGDALDARGDAIEQALNRPPKPLPELKKLVEKPSIWDNPADTSQNVEYEK